MCSRCCCYNQWSYFPGPALTSLSTAGFVAHIPPTFQSATSLKKNLSHLAILLHDSNSPYLKLIQELSPKWDISHISMEFLRKIFIFALPHDTIILIVIQFNRFPPPQNGSQIYLFSCTFTANNPLQISIATFLDFCNTLVSLLFLPDSFPIRNIQQSHTPRTSLSLTAIHNQAPFYSNLFLTLKHLHYFVLYCSLRFLMSISISDFPKRIQS